MTDAPAARSPGEMLSLVSARVRDAHLRKAHVVDGSIDLVSLCRDLSARGLTYALVQDGRDGPDGHDAPASPPPRLGIFTTTDLRDALLRGVPPQQLAVRDIARFELVEIDADADLFEALWLMVRHRVHRLVVREGGQVIGLLGQLDLMSFVADHSYVAALQVDDAASVDELQAASRRIDQMIRLLHGAGLRVERIAQMSGELHMRVLARLWALLAPEEVRAHTCLLVMGSEGRGEQILKTDQDNALLLREGFEWPDLEGLAARFNAALSALGYPPCPGRIMLTNPLWRQSAAAFRQTVHGWMFGGQDDGPMHLAIFFDAVAVSGDATLLEQARGQLMAALAGHNTYLARFAAAADQFHEGGSWLARLSLRRGPQTLDLKKLGLFPIVHGVRALALQAGVQARGTAPRLLALAAARHLDEGLARDLREALHLLMGVRLTHQLRQIDRGELPGNTVQLDALSTLENQSLQDALDIVKRFRLFLRQHFNLDALG